MSGIPSGLAQRALFFATVLFPITASAATVTLYDQDFEAPVGYVNDGADINIFRNVNTLYGGQPTGFAFAQDFTVETLNVSGSERGTGSAAFGTGYSDPDGTGGDFALGMLSGAQDDRLGLSFDVGAFDFFNVGVDISSIDLSAFGGPFVALGDVPLFRFSLFDNPLDTVSIGGSGLLLDSFELAGTASDRTVFDWTRGLFGLSTAGNTNGNVTLQVDLLQGGYAAFDNLVLTASDTPPPPPVAPIPLPAGLPLLLAALAALLPWRSSRRQA